MIDLEKLKAAKLTEARFSVIKSRGSCFQSWSAFAAHSSIMLHVRRVHVHLVIQNIRNRVRLPPSPSTTWVTVNWQVCRTCNWGCPSASLGEWVRGSRTARTLNAASGRARCWFLAHKRWLPFRTTLMTWWGVLVTVWGGAGPGSSNWEGVTWGFDSDVRVRGCRGTFECPAVAIALVAVSSAYTRGSISDAVSSTETWITVCSIWGSLETTINSLVSRFTPVFQWSIHPHLKHKSFPFHGPKFVMFFLPLHQKIFVNYTKITKINHDLCDLTIWVLIFV